MEVEVVLGEVGEADGRELGGHEPPLCDCDRRGLHRTGLVAGLDHRAQGALEVGRLGRGQAGRLAVAADAALDGAEQAGWALRGVQHGRQQERRRGLAVRAGHAGHGELTARMLVQRSGQPRHAVARVVAHDLRHARARAARAPRAARRRRWRPRRAQSRGRRPARRAGSRTANRARSAPSGRRCRRRRRRTSRRSRARRRPRPCTARQAPRGLKSSGRGA